MPSAFIFQNQNHLFLSKSSEWVDGSESQTLLKTLYKDEALNIKAEQSVKNPELRVSITPCELNSKGHPQIKVTARPAVKDDKDEDQASGEPQPEQVGQLEEAIVAAN